MSHRMRPLSTILSQHYDQAVEWAYDELKIYKLKFTNLNHLR